MSKIDSPLSAEHYWTADQLRVMRGLELPAWFRPALHEVPVMAAIEPSTAFAADKSMAETLAEPGFEAQAQPAFQPSAQSADPAPMRPIANHPVESLIVLAGQAELTEAQAQLLGNMLASVGQTLAQVHVLPLLAPGKNTTDPFSETAQQGLDCVHAHVAAMQVKRVIAMGQLAAQTLLGVDDALSVLQEELHDYEGLPLLVMMHPAEYLSMPAYKALAWRDLNRDF
jgi:uracil-DNA glycosylase family 4